MKLSFDRLVEKKIAYLVMRKCGCTSVMSAFEKLRHDPESDAHLRNLHIEKRDSVVVAELFKDHADYYKFTIVRDPVRRFLSFFSNKILSRPSKGNLLVKDPTVLGYRPNVSLDETIGVAIGGKFRPNLHVMPLTDIIDGAGIELDYVGHIEQFDDAIARIAADTGVTLPILHLNKRDRPPVLLNREQFDRLSVYYGEDQRRLGYPDNYDDWYKIHVEQASDEFMTEEGFEFENEAKLLKHDISRLDDRFRVELTWRVHPDHSRKRRMRVVRIRENDRVPIYEVPLPTHRLDRSTDDPQMAQDIVEIPYAVIDPPCPQTELFLDLAFVGDETIETAVILNSAGQKLLYLPLYDNDGK